MFQNIRHAILHSFVVVGTVLALTACTGTNDTTTATTTTTSSPPSPTAPPTSPHPLGQPFHVTKGGPDGYDGLVNAFLVSKVNATNVQDHEPHVFYMFNVRVTSTKGAFPTSDWSLETVNPTAVVPHDPDVKINDHSNDPPLGSKTTGNTAGYISFYVLESATPTLLDLRDPTSSNTLIAQWEVPATP
ncbi:MULTISPECIES: hypothetical protein [unclassified Mycobacteroides]|uniref:hypothetical protein n=1 Tax=unclassified Mycobacteroides TaxID=2618759 RepID=UPI0007143C02|nr:MULTISPECIES: hypothetical protein [unclassified Mycobacteroides]KRQ26401.1 hypothetical protein AOT86_11300 [Mycobacteroides sp. H072]KRQ32601.1 hypothetical protein AOT84_20570 [Mycobacteroides sp. H002]KRQ54027.1 hypothetical protein AOT85_05070 [Mycobacteroides sp. H054]